MAAQWMREGRFGAADRGDGSRAPRPPCRAGLAGNSTVESLSVGNSPSVFAPRLAELEPTNSS